MAINMNDDEKMDKTDLADMDLGSRADDIDPHVREVVALVKPCKEP
jgi:hypothetical protein